MAGPPGTKVSDAGLKHLKGLTQLRRLDLDRTKVSDAGLEHLKGLTQLRRLDLGDTKVTDAGVKKLQRHCRTARFSTTVDAVGRETVRNRGRTPINADREITNNLRSSASVRGSVS